MPSWTNNKKATNSNPKLVRLSVVCNVALPHWFSLNSEFGLHCLKNIFVSNVVREAHYSHNIIDRQILELITKINFAKGFDYDEQESYYRIAYYVTF